MMRVWCRQLVCLVLLFVVTIVYLNGTRILNPFDPNSSYLMNFGYRDRTNAWNDLFFGGSGTWGTYTAYDLLAREYENKKNYGLLDPDQERAYYHQFGNLAQTALSDWQRQRANTMTHSAVGGIDQKYDIQSWARANSAMTALGVAAAVYSGRTLHYRLGSSMGLESRTTMDRSKLERQYLGWQSSVLTTSAGAQMDPGGKSGFYLQKQLTTEVSVSYQQMTAHSIGVNYSRGF